MTSHDHNSPFDADVDEDGNVHMQYKSERLGVLGQGATTETDKSAQGTIEDKLRHKLRKELDNWDRVELDLENGSRADFMAIDFILDKLTPVIQAIITTETTKAKIDELGEVFGEFLAPTGAWRQDRVMLSLETIRERLAQLTDMLATDDKRVSGESDASSNTLQKEQK